MASNYKDFIKEHKKEVAKNGIDGLETYFGSNRYITGNSDGTIRYNTHNLEEMTFDTVEDFADWFFNDNQEVEFMYSISMGHRDDEGEDVLEMEESETFQIDHDIDGCDIWSIVIRIKERDRCSVCKSIKAYEAPIFVEQQSEESNIGFAP